MNKRKVLDEVPIDYLIKLKDNFNNNKPKTNKKIKIFDEVMTEIDEAIYRKLDLNFDNLLKKYQTYFIDICIKNGYLNEEILKDEEEDKIT